VLLAAVEAWVVRLPVVVSSRVVVVVPLVAPVVVHPRMLECDDSILRSAFSPKPFFPFY
jgi:hypothetical protein